MRQYPQRVESGPPPNVRLGWKPEKGFTRGLARMGLLTPREGIETDLFDVPMALVSPRRCGVDEKAENARPSRQSGC